VFARAALTTFCRLDELGLAVSGQRLDPDRAVLACRVVEVAGSDERWCRRCGCEGAPRDTVTRRLAHEPFGWRPTTLLVTMRRYRCRECGHVWRQDTGRAAPPRAKLSRRGLRWALEGIVVNHLTMARVAEGLGVSWNTANDAVLAEGRRVLIEDPGRFDGVRAIGVDEHVWRHTRRGDKYVTVVIDRTAIRAGTGPARLLDMVEGRSKHAFKTWLADRDQAWREGVEVVAMGGFTGFTTAATEELPDAVAVMDPFHVVRLAGDALDRCRRRVQQDLHGHRGKKNDPLYRARRTLHTGADLLTDKQADQLTQLFADEAHVEVEATWGVYQRIIDATAHPTAPRGRRLMQALIESVSRNVPPDPKGDHHAGPDAVQARRRRGGLRRPTRHQQRPHRSHQRPPRTPPRLRPRLPQPHQLHRQIPTRDRRLQTPTTPWNLKSPQGSTPSAGHRLSGGWPNRYSGSPSLVRGPMDHEEQQRVLTDSDRPAHTPSCQPERRACCPYNDEVSLGHTLGHDAADHRGHEGSATRAGLKFTWQRSQPYQQRGSKRRTHWLHQTVAATATPADGAERQRIQAPRRSASSHVPDLQRRM
jgi:transposase